MTKKTAGAIKPDQQVPSGYGRLISVIPLGAKDTVLWFEDASGTIRAIRMGCDTSNGFALETKGIAQIERG